MRYGPNIAFAANGTTNSAGRAISLGRTPRSGVVFSVIFPGSGGTTKCSVRPEVQMGYGSTRWLPIGAAATTVKSTQAGFPFKTTSATPFTRVRLRLVTRTTGSGAGADSVTAYIAGV